MQNRCPPLWCDLNMRFWNGIWIVRLGLCLTLHKTKLQFKVSLYFLHTDEADYAV